MRKTNFKQLIFDLDGVLVNTTPCHESAYSDLWRMLEIQGPPYSEIAGRRTLDVVEEVTRYLEGSAQEIQSWVSYKQQHALLKMEQQTLVFPESKEILRTLHAENWPMSIATGASRGSTEIALKVLGAQSYINYVVTADDVSLGKPNPEIFNLVLDKTGSSPRHALVVEDSSAGIEAAVCAGVMVCSVRTGEQHPSPLFIGAFDNLRSALQELRIVQ